ncbi:hypothetical protein IRJ41_003501 [Triplophysa rosa]|uniref:C1q domain-containing protein n=1 Tax=Triplophysa rosa TaxID=992332 RepID=A0A9W8C7C8_TRIRA|nr:hypothetical protein IRJ41_003501 [Triplophysa rosa]
MFLTCGFISSGISLVKVSTQGQDLLSPQINILDELGKIKTLEQTMKSMETELERLRVENKASKVAFSASLVSSHGPHNIGPVFGEFHTLVYNHVYLNTGNAYDSNTGIFTAPIRGVYAFRVFSKAHGDPEKALTAGLFKNDQHIFSTHAYQRSGFISSSNGVSLLLEKGHEVKVNLYPRNWIFDNGEHHHSTFSGHLLFQM